MTLSMSGAVPSNLISSETNRSLPPAQKSAARTFVLGALAVLSVAALAVVPVACSSGGVGDPCTPEDEYDAQFGGFTVSLDNLESRSFQCSTRLCLVNHFQGRVSCPQGQAAPTSCKPGSACADGKDCVLSQIFAPTCSNCAPGDTSCAPVTCPDGLNCVVAGGGAGTGSCECTSDTTVDGVSYYCQGATSDPSSPQVLQAYVCHTKGECQTIAGADTKANEGKDCCIPGTDNPVSVSVCGQCAASTQRDAADAVYCSCRCCAPCCDPHANLTPEQAADQGCSTDLSTCGPACDSNFNYCDCPGGFTCTGIRPNVGLGGAQLAGAYCVKNGTAYTGQTASCSSLVGVGTTSANPCTGTPTAPTH